ncbi:MAG: XRE family transcriptional regulator [Deltaproteobacteria bacterium]|nr:MAG: XRE family transcriptional regulator [Deltaproteobacteria bacterium]
MAGEREELKELKLGEKIRALRQKKGFTIQDVAESTGLSKALISQVENDVVIPPVATLLKISRALGVHIGYFFQESEREMKIEVVRSDERKKVKRRFPRGKDPLSYSYESLSHRKADKHMEPFLVEFDSEIDEEVPMLSHGGEEFLHLLEGELEFRTPETVITLKPGDSLYFNSDVPHAFRGVGKGKARAIVVLYTG